MTWEPEGKNYNPTCEGSTAGGRGSAKCAGLLLPTSGIEFFFLTTGNVQVNVNFQDQ